MSFDKIHSGKIPYSSFNNRYRPYLEVVFSNGNLKSGKTLAIVDSGADHTLIPFSIGSLIGLEAPIKSEMSVQVSGVGGNLNYVERKCRIYIVNKLKNKIFGFDESVWWVYPNKEMLLNRNELLKNFDATNRLKSQCKNGTALFEHFGNQQEEIIRKIKNIDNALETGVLLGRPFFDNFDFIQFCHRDRIKEEKCFFTYKILKEKIAEEMPLSNTDILNISHKKY